MRLGFRLSRRMWISVPLAPRGGLFGLLIWAVMMFGWLIVMMFVVTAWVMVVMVQLMVLGVKGIVRAVQATRRASRRRAVARQQTLAR